MKKIIVLYINHDTNIVGGSSRSLLNLIRSAQNTIYPIVLNKKEGVVNSYFENNGIETIIYNFDNCIIRKRFGLRSRLNIPFVLINNYKCANALYNILYRRGINIIHSNSSCQIVGYLLSQKLACKHVWHIREFLDDDFDMIPILGRRWLKSKVFKADAVIAITKAIYTKWDLKKHNNSFCLWDAVRSRNDTFLNLRKEKYFLFCAAQISKAKGLDFCMKAFEKSGLHKHGYKLKVIGIIPQKYKQEITIQLANLECADSIAFIGEQNDISEYMKNATAFIMSSHNEGLGRVTVEAMFYGCPVIARDTGGTTEIIIDHQTGYKFQTIEECAQKMVDVTKYNLLHMITNAQKFAQKNFSEEEYREKILSVYESL